MADVQGPHRPERQPRPVRNGMGTVNADGDGDVAVFFFQ